MLGCRPVRAEELLCRADSGRPVTYMNYNIVQAPPHADVCAERTLAYVLQALDEEDLHARMPPCARGGAIR
jgi:hypothetical protein